MVFNHLISGHVDLVQQVGENENRIQVSSPAAVTSLFVVFFPNYMAVRTSHGNDLELTWQAAMLIWRHKRKYLLEN